jgi:hypothetical protein
MKESGGKEEEWKMNCEQVFRAMAHNRVSDFGDTKLTSCTA